MNIRRRTARERVEVLLDLAAEELGKAERTQGERRETAIVRAVEFLDSAEVELERDEIDPVFYVDALEELRTLRYLRDLFPRPARPVFLRLIDGGPQ